MATSSSTPTACPVRRDAAPAKEMSAFLATITITYLLEAVAYHLDTTSRQKNSGSAILIAKLVLIAVSVPASPALPTEETLLPWLSADIVIAGGDP